MVGTPGYTQVATYWGTPVLDGFGNRTFTAPVEIMVRWEERTDLEIIVSGEHVPSKARVFVLQAIDLGGYLALGDYTATSSPLALDNAYPIRAVATTLSIDGQEYTRKVML